MKKINSLMLVLLTLMLSTILLATSCGKQSSEENSSEKGDKVCEHIWSDATCTVAKTCSVCGETEGEALGHTWADATCTAAKTCSVCAETEGEAPGHTWTDATCTVAKTCSVCAETEGEALGHTWADATCTVAKTCSVCTITEGEALGHTWTDATCTAAKTCSTCKATSGSALGHNWTEATCTVPKTCSKCKETEGSALGHKWKNATCTAPKTCSICKTTSGSTVAHTYVNNKCSKCGKSDIKNISVGQIVSEYNSKNKAFEYYIFIFNSNDVTFAADFEATVEIKTNRGILLKKININGKVKDFQKYHTQYNGDLLGYKISISTNTLKELGFVTGEFRISVNCENESAFSVSSQSLPIDINLPELPTTIHNYSGYSKTQSFVITEITYEDSGYGTIYLYFSGKKTYDSKGDSYSRSGDIAWKLYDSHGNIIDSGFVYTPGLTTGEGFKNSKDYIFEDLDPKETYTLKILSVTD